MSPPTPLPPPQARWLLALTACWAALVALSIFLCGDGFLHPESYSFLPHYLSGRPLIELIFDNRVTDWGNYQARELAFVFDWLDAQFIGWSVAHGHPHFFSASHYLFLLAGGFALWRICVCYLDLDRLCAAALVLLLWTAPSAMLYTSFYRCAKVALLTTTLLAVLGWLRASKAPAGFRSHIALALFGVTALLLPMFDKLGLIFLVGFVAFLARNFAVSRSVRELQLLGVGSLALILAWSYQKAIGPAITRHLLGYEVNRGYTAFPFADLLSNPRLLLTVAAGAPIFALDSFRVPLGNLSAGLALLALLAIAAGLDSGTAPARAFWLRRSAIFGGLVLFIMAAFAAMLAIFPQMFSNEHRRFCYPLPMAGWWFPAVAAALAACLRRQPSWRRGAAVGLGAMVLSNLFALQEHRFVLRQGKYEPYVQNAALVRAALTPGAAPKFEAAQIERWRKDAPYFPDAVPPSLELDRIFLTLHPRSPRGA